MKCYILSLGQVDYLESLKLQERLMDLRQIGKIEDTLILLEHPHCLTRGTRMKGMPLNTMIRVPLEELERLGVKVYDTDRGGYITYHGPGQLIAYPIINFSERKGDKFTYMEALEDVMINTLWNNDIEAVKKRGEAANAEKFASYIGAWYKEGDAFYKVGSVGVKFGWVKDAHITKHGLALNVNTDLSKFSLIDQCSFKDVEAMSMQKILGKPADMRKVKGYLSANFMRAFGYDESKEIRLEEILAL